MIERPILFSAPMVRALLDGTKTQTRRIVKPQPEPTPANYVGPVGHWWPCKAVQSMVHVEQEMQNKSGGWGGFVETICPYGKPGDRLWVRETWAQPATLDPGPTVYRADYPACVPDGFTNLPAVDEITWKPSIHMFRRASRILLEITSVRVERLQAIGEADARAEGVTIEERHTVGYCAGEFLPPSIRAYRDLWEHINGAGSWDANLWVWVVEFKRVQP